MTLVLDTNVVIDWLVFDHPYMNALREGVRAGSLVIVTHPPAVEELRRVLGYRALRLDAAKQQALVESYEQQTSLAFELEGMSINSLPLPRGFPRCRDRDDDPFLALAYRTKGSVLVSRDEAVLKLKRRAARFGLEILDVQELIEQRLAGRA
jgi:putative PIN family toxin of toxin-antitoxin system